MKILVNTPCISKQGGVANHFKGLMPYWSEDVRYNFTAGRYFIPGAILLPFDLIVYFFKLFFGRYDVVVLNPSLGKTALVRDAAFLKVASLFRVKKIVFFHGWKEDVELSITNNPRIFMYGYGDADAFLVLSSSFRNKLIEWGVKAPVFVTTTKVDDLLIKGFDVERKVFSNTILFLARIENYKGVLIAVDAFSILKAKYPNLRLLVVGDGSQVHEVRKYIDKNNVEDVHLTGNLSGQELVKAYSESDIYVLPTDGEGMPTTVLEAMAFGLPVITRPVGGLNDFFESPRMGCLVKSKDANDFADAVEKFIKDEDLLKDTSVYNHVYAKRHFMASRVVKGVEELILHVVVGV